MPIYEYRCKDCDHRFDIAQSFTDHALTVCPACGGALKKVFGSVGITFKGSGFYKTDSRSTPSTAESGTKSGETPSEKVGAGKEGPSGSEGSSNGTSESNGKGSGSSGSGESTQTKKDGKDTSGPARSKSAKSRPGS
jgi:putative FmdB family regulatory protein